LLAGGLAQRTLPEVAAGRTLVVSRRNSEISTMVDDCISVLGGIDSLIPAGSRVAVKVNGSWSNPGANTNPEVLGEVLRLIWSARPSRVTVYDHLIQSAGWSAISRATESASTEALALGRRSADYLEMEIPGVALGSAGMARILDESDVLVNVPVLKTHGSGQISIGLKNHLGSVKDRGDIHDGGGKGLHRGIADLNACPAIAEKHAFTICDAIDPMVTGGPSRGTHAHYNGIIAGRDPVATDYIGTQIIRRYNSRLLQTPTQVQMAADLGLGTCDPDLITFDERDYSMEIPDLGIPTLTSMTLLGMYLRERLSSPGPDLEDST
jgi:uncharacterized protein (DUF362 family)